MATSSVNLIDAIADAIPRGARSRSAVLRIGTVVSVSGQWCMVRVGSNNDADAVMAGYHTFYTPAAGKVVSLINDGDRWLVLGEIRSS